MFGAETLSLANQAPIAICHDGIDVSAGTPVIESATLLANDFDFEQDTLTLVSVGNAAPVTAEPLEDISAVEDSTVSFAMPAGTFTDAGGDALTLTATLPDWLSFDGTVLAGTLPQEFSGNLTIVVVANDGATSPSDIFSLTITLANDAPDFEQPGDQDADNPYEVTAGVSDGDLTARQDVTVAVTDLDEVGPKVAPIAVDDNAALDEDGSATIDVLANDIDEGPLSIADVTGALNGTF